MDSLAAHILSWFTAIHGRYGVNPLVFAALYFIGVPPFWYALYLAGTALRKGKLKLMKMYLILAGCINIAPFIYVYLFGQNLPPYFWMILSVIALLLTLPIVIKASSSPVKPP